LQSESLLNAIKLSDQANINYNHRACLFKLYRRTFILNFERDVFKIDSSSGDK